MKISGLSEIPPAASTTMQGTKDEFLKLFMAKLQHQDPLDPKTGADMVAQLAQLSAVEQARATNQQLAELAASQASTASAGLSSLIGRTCDVAVGEVQLDQGAVPPIEVSSGTPINGASVVITDADGKELRRIAIPNGGHAATIAWDGKDAAGNPARPGAYQISIEPGTTSAPIVASWHGAIDAVELTADGPRLRIGGVLVSPASVRTIGSQRTSTTTTSIQGALS